MATTDRPRASGPRSPGCRTAPRPTTTSSPRGASSSSPATPTACSTRYGSSTRAPRATRSRGWSTRCSPRRAASKDGRDDDYVAMCLLHDIGDTLAPRNHGELAASVLKPFVPERITWIAAHHPVFQLAYYGHQVGADPESRARYAGHEWFDDTVEFCECTTRTASTCATDRSRSTSSSRCCGPHSSAPHGGTRPTSDRNVADTHTHRVAALPHRPGHEGPPSARRSGVVTRLLVATLTNATRTQLSHATQGACPGAALFVGNGLVEQQDLLFVGRLKNRCPPFKVSPCHWRGCPLARRIATFSSLDQLLQGRIEVVQFDSHPRARAPSRFSSRSTRAQWPHSKITLWPRARRSWDRTHS